MGRNTNCKWKKRSQRINMNCIKLMPYKNRRFKRKVHKKKDRKTRSAKKQKK